MDSYKHLYRNNSIVPTNIKYTYSRTTTAFMTARTVKILCKPLEILKINTKDIEILVALGITMVPVLKKEFIDVKNACLAKNIEWNVKNMKIILSKFLYLSATNSEYFTALSILK